MPQVSIIMPAYNAAPYIAQSIASIQAQTFEDWELIVVNDGSTDDTEDVVQLFMAGDPRIKYFWQENGRQGKARNKALANIPAERPFIAFLDADDLWMPEKLGLQIAQITESGADGVFCSAVVFSEASEQLDIQRAEEGIYKGEEAIRAFIRKNRIGILTALVRRAAIEAAGRFPEQRPIQNCEDYYLWLRMLMNGNTLRAYSEPMARYRVHAAAATASMLNILRPEIATFTSLTFATPALESERYRRLVLLYRDLFMALAKEDNRKEIAESIDAFSKMSSLHLRPARILRSTLHIHPALFRKVSWRLLGAIAR